MKTSFFFNYLDDLSMAKEKTGHSWRPRKKNVVQPDGNADDLLAMV
jgi:hypothetical protein